MAQCPKCGRKLHVYNWRPNCPGCGVNIMFAGYEQQFEKDRRITEMTLARTKSNFTKFKCAFVGSKLSKIRIVTALLPLAGLLVPFGSLTLSTPIYEKSIALSLLGLLDAFTGGYLFNMGAYTGGPVLGETFAALTPALLAYFAVAAIAVLILLTEILCFFNFKVTSVVLSVMGFLGIAASAATEIFLHKLAGAAASVCGVEIGIGFYIQAACFIPIIIISAILAKTGVPYNFAPGIELRVSYYRKYKKGEIKLMDIPTPIYLSDEDRAEKERLTKELFNISEEDKKEELQNV